jgi:chemotaxis signal transduction protein
MSMSTPTSAVSTSTSRLGQAVCSFWLGERPYAIDVAVVGEVVVVDHLIPVPRTPPAVLGMFALRGAPLACVDLATALALPERAITLRQDVPTLVIRPRNAPIAAVAIGRIDAVLATHGGAFLDANRENEHPSVVGFFTPAGRTGALTVLDPGVVFDRLQALRYR